MRLDNCMACDSDDLVEPFDQIGFVCGHCEAHHWPDHYGVWRCTKRAQIEACQAAETTVPDEFSPAR